MDTPHFSKLQHYWSLTIKLFSIKSKTHIGVSCSSSENQSVYSTAPAEWGQWKGWENIYLVLYERLLKIYWIFHSLFYAIRYHGLSILKGGRNTWNSLYFSCQGIFRFLVGLINFNLTSYMYETIMNIKAECEMHSIFYSRIINILISKTYVSLMRHWKW